jgi:hypothetical protein
MFIITRVTRKGVIAASLAVLVLTSCAQSSPTPDVSAPPAAAVPALPAAAAPSPPTFFESYLPLASDLDLAVPGLVLRAPSLNIVTPTDQPQIFCGKGSVPGIDMPTRKALLGSASFGTPASTTEGAMHFYYGLVISNGHDKAQDWSTNQDAKFPLSIPVPELLGPVQDVEPCEHPGAIVVSCGSDPRPFLTPCLHPQLRPGTYSETPSQSGSWNLLNVTLTPVGGPPRSTVLAYQHILIEVDGGNSDLVDAEQIIEGDCGTQSCEYSNELHQVFDALNDSLSGSVDLSENPDLKRAIGTGYGS